MTSRGSTIDVGAWLRDLGLHVMFLELRHPLEPGKTVEATLQFEKAGTVKVEFPIGASAPRVA